LFESTLPDALARFPAVALAPGVSVGFDVSGEGRWRVLGSETATRVTIWSSGRCDCEVRCDPQDLERLLAGGFRAARAYATGRVVVEGDIGLLLILRDIVTASLGSGQ
jgi:putative sterol carrier protein